VQPSFGDITAGIFAGGNYNITANRFFWQPVGLKGNQLRTSMVWESWKWLHGGRITVEWLAGCAWNAQCKGAFLAPL